MLTEENTKIINLLTEINESLRSIDQVLLITNFQNIKEIYLQNLDTKSKKQVYSLYDGIRTIKEIEQESGVNVRFISEWGQEWEKIGLINQQSGKNKGKRKIVFSLDELGIEV
ncbi:MAG: hypothetical protein ACYDH2_00505 [Anaerolineaceae bacterium]